MTCPHCGGAVLYRNEDDDLACLCGKVLYDPEQLAAALEDAQGWDGVRHSARLPSVRAEGRNQERRRESARRARRRYEAKRRAHV